MQDWLVLTAVVPPAGVVFLQSRLCSTEYKTLWDSEVNTSDGGFAVPPA